VEELVLGLESELAPKVEAFFDMLEGTGGIEHGQARLRVLQKVAQEEAQMALVLSCSTARRLWETPRSP